MHRAVLDFNTFELVYETPDSDGLDEFLDHPSCALRKDGTCALAHTDYCYRLCPNGNAGGPG